MSSMTSQRIFFIGVISIFVTIAILPLGYLAFTPLIEGGDRTALSGVFEIRHMILAKHSLMISIGTALASLLIGSAVAFLISRTDMPGRKLLGRIYILPLLIPPYIHGLVWSYLNPQLQTIFHFDIYSIRGVIMVLTLAYFPFVTLTTLAGLNTVDRHREEAALMARGPVHAVTRITLPLCLPNILCGVIFVFIFSIINVGVPDILRVRVYPLEVFIQFSAFFNTWNAVWLSLPMMAVTVLGILGLQVLMGNRSYVQIGSRENTQMRFPLKKSGPIWAFGCAGILLCAVIIPVATLLVKAGGWETYLRVLQSSIHPLFLSLSIAIAAAVLTVLMGFGLGYLHQRGTPRLKMWMGFLVSVPFAVPATTLGIGLIGVWNRNFTDWVYQGMGIMIIAHMARFTSYAALIMHSGIGQVGKQLEESASLSGAGFFSVLATIVIPLVRRHLLSAAFLVFVLAFGELGVTLLISPPGVETIPIKIYNLMHYGAEDMVAAMCVILISIIFGLLSVFLWIMKN